MACSLIKHPHVLSAAAVCQYYGVDPEFGLTREQVEVHRARFGVNELSHEEGKSIWTLLLEQFQDLLARILLAAAFVSFLLALLSGEEGLTGFVEPLVILLILAANAIVSIWQESSAEKSLEALKRLQPELARVLRQGEWTTVPAKELVPGDICEIRVGDKIPADLRVLTLNTVSLRAEQSELTGEAQTVPKEAITLDPMFTDCEIQSKINMLFASTTVANGSARAVVTATGMRTEIGEVQSAVQAAGEEEEQTPLQQKLDEFGEMLSKVIGIICVLVWLINFGNFNEPSHGGFIRGCIYYFKTAVALAVAAIPEGLTAVITTCLALGTRKMEERDCSPSSVGGNIGVYHGHMFGQNGDTDDQRDELRAFCCAVLCDTEDRGLQHFVRCASLCNESRLRLGDEGKIVRQGEPTELALKVLVEKLGCPNAELNREYLQQSHRDTEVFGRYWAESMKKLAVLEFTRDRKSMSVLYYDTVNAKNIQYVKGAPESLLERCTYVMLPDGAVRPLTPQMHQTISEEIESMTAEALRTLALAVRLDVGVLQDYTDSRHPAHQQLEDPENFIKFEQDLIFCGVVGLIDPPRPEVARAIKICKRAGIKVIMITGDNKKTAEAVAVKIGIVDGKDLSRISYTGKEFEALSENEKIRVLSSPRGAVFSRTEPKHKQLVIRILKELGEITAMTGDGVNDAPALKQADIGIAMGITGTEVAKEASDMVLADDDFMSIVLAVEEGRSIYNNMKAFIRYLISSNIGEVASIFLTAALGIPEGLVPVQLLWVNLVTDGFPATALGKLHLCVTSQRGVGFNPPDVDVMKKSPRKRDDPLISAWVFFRYMVIGLYVGVATVGIFIWWFVYGIDPQDGHTVIPYWQLSHWTQCHQWSQFRVNTVYGMDSNDPCTYFNQGKIKASTLSLTVLVIIEMLNALNALSEDGSLLHMPPWANPWLLLAIFGSVAVHCLILYVQPLAAIFGVVPLSLHDWTWVVIWAFPVLLIDEILKAYTRMREHQKGLKGRVQLSERQPKKVQ